MKEIILSSVLGKLSLISLIEKGIGILKYTFKKVSYVFYALNKLNNSYDVNEMKALVPSVIASMSFFIVLGGI